MSVVERLVRLNQSANCPPDEDHSRDYAGSRRLPSTPLPVEFEYALNGALNPSNPSEFGQTGSEGVTSYSEDIFFGKKAHVYPISSENTHLPLS